MDLTIYDLVELANSRDTKMLDICPICGRKVNVVFDKQTRMRVSCRCNDKIHSFLRKENYYVSPNEAINDWNKYCHKIFSLRESKEKYMGIYVISCLIVVAIIPIVMVFASFSIIPVIVLNIICGYVFFEILGPKVIAIRGNGAVNLFYRHEITEFKNSFREIETNKIDEHTQTLLSKLKNDNEALEKLLHKIDDKKMIVDIEILVEVSKEIYVYLNKHPSKTSIAISFIYSYQASVLQVVKDFVTLKKVKQDTNSLMLEMKNTIHDAIIIYQDEYDSITRESIADIEANLKVLQNEIKGRK